MSVGKAGGNQNQPLGEIAGSQERAAKGKTKRGLFGGRTVLRSIVDGYHKIIADSSGKSNTRAKSLKGLIGEFFTTRNKIPKDKEKDTTYQSYHNAAIFDKDMLELDPNVSPIARKHNGYHSIADDSREEIARRHESSAFELDGLQDSDIKRTKLKSRLSKSLGGLHPDILPEDKIINGFRERRGSSISVDSGRGSISSVNYEELPKSGPRLDKKKQRRLSNRLGGLHPEASLVDKSIDTRLRERVDSSASTDSGRGSIVGDESDLRVDSGQIKSIDNGFRERVGSSASTDSGLGSIVGDQSDLRVDSGQISSPHKIVPDSVDELVRQVLAKKDSEEIYQGIQQFTTLVLEKVKGAGYSFSNPPPKHVQNKRYDQYMTMVAHKLATEMVKAARSQNQGKSSKEIGIGLMAMDVYQHQQVKEKPSSDVKRTMGASLRLLLPACGLEEQSLAFEIGMGVSLQRPEGAENVDKELKKSEDLFDTYQPLVEQRLKKAIRDDLRDILSQKKASSPDRAKRLNFSQNYVDRAIKSLEKMGKDTTGHRLVKNKLAAIVQSEMTILRSQEGLFQKPR